jgi:hypothetical protein
MQRLKYEREHLRSLRIVFDKQDALLPAVLRLLVHLVLAVSAVEKLRTEKRSSRSRGVVQADSGARCFWG